MEKLKNFYQKILHSPKLFLLTGATILSIVLIIFTASVFPKKPKTPSSTIPVLTTTPKITPFVGPITTEEPLPTPTLSIRWTNREVSIPDSLEIYSIKLPLISPGKADSISQKLGLNTSDEQPSIDDSLRTWNKGEISLSTNFLDNELIFSSGNVPTTQSSVYTEDSYLLAANNYLQNIFGSAFTKTLEKQSVAYLKQQNFYTVLSPANEATLVRVSYYQTINSYPLATISQSGAVVTILLDKNLGLNGLTVKDAFSSITSLGKFNTVPLSEQIKNANAAAIRINASSYYDIAIDTVSAKNITFNQTTVRVAYLAYNKQYIPVYLLEGTVKTSVTSEQPGLYILPATK